MGQLRRLATIALAVALLIALTSLPSLRTCRNTGSAFAPAIAWAGGSPDETLKPPTPPPPSEKSARLRVDRGYIAVERMEQRPAHLTLAERMQLLYHVYLASVLRI